jgi:prepilin-type N-terminal cleavage/methylation domain-containing protein
VIVDHLELTEAKAGQRGSRARGFSLMELLISIIVSTILTAIAVVELQPAIQGLRADAAMAQVKSVLRQARETSIAERRDVAVFFVPPSTISLFRFNILPGGGGQVLAGAPFLSVPMEGPTQFMTFAGEADTPDAFGIPPVPQGIMFNGVVGGPPAGMQFQSDGTFISGAGTVINGTVFIGFPGTPSSSRAITIMGATGRIKAWHGAPGTTWWTE